MIWDFQDALTRRLLLWSFVSGVVGSALLVLGDPFWRGFGLQALVWGAIDAGIAVFGRRSARKRRLVYPGGASNAEQEARNLRRLLWINAGLDALYIAGGLVLVYTLGANDLFARGNGWGIVAQGGFLFVFDFLHALAVPNGAPIQLPFAPFSGVEHQAFALEGGKPAALLLHGFLGTPAEMRGLGVALNEAGWTVSAPLLPGFGADLGALFECQHEQWTTAALAAGEKLRADGHAPLVLVGFSMGAAVALILEPLLRPAGLVLLAPFSWPEPRWLPPVEFVVRPFLPIGLRPMRKVNLDSSEARRSISAFMPDLDLDDPAVRLAVRDFRVPLGLIDQIRALSRQARQAAPRIAASVVVAQGARDRVARPAQTVALAKLLPRPPQYVIVDSEHNMTDPANPAWPVVRQTALDFVDRFEAG